MKTIRRLALLALFTAGAGTAAAQPAVKDGTPTPITSKSTTTHDLRDVVPTWFKGAAVEGKGDAATFSLPKVPHTLEGGKETMQWSVYFRLHQRADRPTIVRIFFPCQAVPANAHPDRLADLMNMSGGIQDSPAYFIVSGGKDRMLTLVTEMPADGLERVKLEAEIKGLFRAAERTSNLWGGDLSKPLAKMEEKKEEKNPLTGHWNVLHAGYNAASAPPAPFVAGLNYLYLADDGTVSAGVQEGEKTDDKGLISRKGTYSLKGDQLTLEFGDRKTAETYTVKVKGGKLTLNPDKGNTAGVADKEITLNKW